MKGLKQALVFSVCLWVIVVVAYARQVGSGGGVLNPIPMDNASCSSSSSSGGNE